MHARLATGIALASMTALLLVGCTPDAPDETTPPPTPLDTTTADPQETALTETAETTYENYLNARSVLTQSPDADLDAILEYSTQRQAALAYADVAVLVGDGTMLEGRFEVTGSALEVADDHSPQVVICVDNADVRLVDRNTGDSTPATPTDPVLVTFATEGSLKVDEVAAVGDGSDDQCR